MDWPAEAQKAQDALRAAALTAAESAEAVDEEAPDGSSASHGDDHAQASTGMHHPRLYLTCMSPYGHLCIYQQADSTGQALSGQML